MSPRAAFHCAEGWFQGLLRSAGRGKRLLARGRADARPSLAAVTPPPRKKISAPLRLCVKRLSTLNSHFGTHKSGERFGVRRQAVFRATPFFEQCFSAHSAERKRCRDPRTARLLSPHSKCSAAPCAAQPFAPAQREIMSILSKKHPAFHQKRMILAPLSPTDYKRCQKPVDIPAAPIYHPAVFNVGSFRILQPRQEG